MRTSYKNYEIELFNDRLYDPSSKDNVTDYNKFYGDIVDLRTSNHGIRVYENKEVISSAIVSGLGGSTTIHSHSFVIKNEIIFICCASSIYALSLPLLDFKWRKECDTATCFEIYEYADDLIIHGECEISRITIKGDIRWQFSGSDIFVNLEGKDRLRIEEDLIIAYDFQGYEYMINGNGETVE